LICRYIDLLKCLISMNMYDAFEFQSAVKVPGGLDPCSSLRSVAVY